MNSDYLVLPTWFRDCRAVMQILESACESRPIALYVICAAWCIEQGTPRIPRQLYDSAEDQSIHGHVTFGPCCADVLVDAGLFAMHDGSYWLRKLGPAMAMAEVNNELRWESDLWDDCPEEVK